MLKRVVLLLFSLAFFTSLSLAATFESKNIEPKLKNSIGVVYEYMSFYYTIPFSQFLSHEERIDGSLLGLRLEHKNKLDTIEYRIKLNYLFADNLHFLGKAKFNYPNYHYESETRDKFKASKFHIDTALFVRPQLLVTDKLPRIERFTVNIKPGAGFGYDSYSLQNERRLESIYVAPAVSLSFLDRIDLAFYLKLQRNYVKVFDYRKTFSSVTPGAALSFDLGKLSLNVFYEKREQFKTKSVGGSILFRF